MFRACCLSVTVLFPLLTATAWADPCGMVPPIYVGDGLPITRIGLQKTYVFHQDGVEAFIIRPGFEGKVEEFGMLIPFPSPPAVRKVSDAIFDHIERAVDPPEVVIDLTYIPPPAAPAGPGGGGGGDPGAFLQDRGLGINEVRVLREEAIGMYEVAVLEAGSSAALKKWMEDHKYRYPDGMDKVCDEYVELRWCFVAVKTKVGAKSGVDPQPGSREVEHAMPQGSTFDGFVQAMGFRFPTQEIVVPMRLSAFNEGDRRNVVYLLTDGPRKIRAIPEEYVVRQVAGADLLANVTGPLPLRIIGGTPADVQPWQRGGVEERRNPAPHNGLAKDLFASDLLAVSSQSLALPFEEADKSLLRIGEHFGLRGPDVDALHEQEMARDRQQAVEKSLSGLKDMTLTMLDGDFPREVLASANLQFGEFKMPHRRNNIETYHAVAHQPSDARPGRVYHGEVKFTDEPRGDSQTPLPPQLPFNTRPWWQRFSAFAAVLAALMFGLAWGGSRRKGSTPASP